MVRGRTGFSMLGGRLAVLAVSVAALALPTAAMAHTERPSYWPDPAPDTTVVPAAGGAVPSIRTLASALDKRSGSRTFVVCQDDSLSRLREAVGEARLNGYDIRPTDHRELSDAAAKQLLDVNKKLFAKCRYDEIQPAVMDAGNNDRVVVMPGLYTEPTARAQKTHDPACDQYEINTEFGDPGALSYDYQWNCPNDQNLIAVLGRAPGTGEDPDPPPRDRHGIPNLGPCVRCNLQLEGSGVSADDVVIDAGNVEAGNGGPHGAKKDVVIRADRADGFVLRNVTVRHAREHGVYVLESDGYALDRFKAYYNGLYGTLTFVEDHGLQQNCEAVGHGDSGIYPGASAETGVQRKEGTEFRLNQEIRWCDLHRNLAGYSGTNGNAVWFHDNNVYGNTLGIQTDIVTAAGHPGFPGDSALFEDNRIYSNNYNPYEPGADFSPSFPFPVGTGLWIAGGNHHTVRDNHFYDNWRRGTMLYTVPDALICGPASGGNSQEGCDEKTVSTSHNNTFAGNVMGISPDGDVAPNGTDFWWDQFPGSRGNCWYDNSGPAPITSSPPAPLLPDCLGGTLPESSVGTGNPVNEGELLACFVAYQTDNYDPATCPWFATPPKPGSAAARRQDLGAQRAAQRKTLVDFCASGGPAPTCAPFRDLLAARGLLLDPELVDLRAASPRSLSAWGLIGPAVSGKSTPLSQYTCKQWRRAGTNQRIGVVRRIVSFVGGRVSGKGAFGWGPVLRTEHAMSLFDTRCARRGSSGFLLYKLYGFPAGFAGVAPLGFPG